MLGGVITALNEEAVVCAAIGNKGGINLVASYEAFAVKMLGAIRQELTFSRQSSDAGEPPGWLSVPVIATSHTWENGKNELSHQDPTFCEALLSEPSDVSRVLFPADWNSAVAALRATYASRGQIWTLVVPKRDLPVHLSAEQAQRLAEDGAVCLRASDNPDRELQLVATGGYQLGEVLTASARLEAAGVGHSVVYLQEPGRYRLPRDARETAIAAPAELVERLFPASAPARVFLTHTRPGPFIGTVWPLLADPVTTPVLGFINHGGTLDESGMLFANRCTWAHALAAAAVALGDPPETLLEAEEYAAILGSGDPAVIRDRASAPIR
jgi:phosphoketolase